MGLNIINKNKNKIIQTPHGSLLINCYFNVAKRYSWDNNGNDNIKDNSGNINIVDNNDKNIQLLHYLGFKLACSLIGNRVAFLKTTIVQYLYNNEYDDDNDYDSNDDNINKSMTENIFSMGYVD